MKRFLLSLALIFAALPAFATDPQFGAIRIEASQNVRHAFTSSKTQGADATKVSANEWNAAHTAPDVLIASVPTGFVWPAQPTAVTEFCGGSTSYRWRANLANYTTIRLTAQVVSAGAATAALRLQYTTDTTGASGWAYLDSVSGPSVSINATGVTVSASVSIDTAAKADVLLRLVGINGDGAGGTACYSTIKASTATLADAATALAANGTNCAGGSAAAGVDASGNAEGCFAVPSGTGTVSGTNTGDQTTISGNAGTATALAANGANCSAGSYPLGVDASGAAESCTVAFSATVASGPTYCADAGASDDYACNLSPAPASYASIIGVPITFKANTVNTGASTINLNSLGAQAIVKVGATVTTATVDNDIRAGSIVTVQYDGTNFQCLSCGGNGANLNIANAWLKPQTFAAGSLASPSVLFSGGTNLGLFQENGNKVAVSNNGTGIAAFTTVVGGINHIGMMLPVSGEVGWHSNPDPGAVVPDLILFRDAAAVLQLGLDVNGAAINQTLKAHDGITGTDIKGASLTLSPGLGTGAAVSNPLTLNRVVTKATGTTAQTYSPSFVACPTKILSNTSATTQTVATITTTSTTGGSVTMDYSVVANNGTLQNVDGGMVKVAWGNNAGTVTSTMTAVALQADADASGTLAATPTRTDATNVISIKLTPTWVTIVPTTVTAWITFTLHTSGDTVACQ